MSKEKRVPIAKLNSFLYKNEKGFINISMKIDASKPQYFIHLISYIIMCTYDRLEGRAPIALEELKINDFQEWVETIVEDIEYITSENRKAKDNNGS